MPVKITIEIPNVDVAKLVEKALKDSAWNFEMKRDFCKKQYETIQAKDNPSPQRKKSILDYYARIGAENFVLSEQLWEIGQDVAEQANVENKEMEMK